PGNRDHAYVVRRKILLRKPHARKLAGANRIYLRWSDGQSELLSSNRRDPNTRLQRAAGCSAAVEHPVHPQPGGRQLTERLRLALLRRRTGEREFRKQSA